MGFEHLDDTTRAAVVGSQRVDREVVLAYWKTLIDVDPDEYQAEIEAEVGALRAPCLAVFGHSLADSERDHLRRLVRNVELEEWDGRGHFVHLAERDRFTTRLRTFLEALVGTFDTGVSRRAG
jgi:pimeloyl-ACP methyl ester carboxylesterase